MKLNLNTHDIYALVTELQYLIGSQVVNIYDINNKTICIKLRCKNNNQNEIVDEIDDKIVDEKFEDTSKYFLKYLIIESSLKFYLIDNFMAVNQMPSSFCSKLRKHLKNKRISKFEQLNIDRVVGIKFGTTDISKSFFAHNLICEFYASGNIILTDDDYNIMTLIHPYVYKNNDNKNIARVCVGNKYPISLATINTSLEFDEVKNMILTELAKTNKKIKIKQFIMKLPILMYSPCVVEHAMIMSNIDPNIKLDMSDNNVFTDKVICEIINNIKHLYNLSSFKGYSNNEIFSPYLYSQMNKDCQLCEFDTFSECVSNHFKNIDNFETKKKANTTTQTKLSTSNKVVENIKNQILSMEKNIDDNYTSIKKIEENIEKLDSFLKTINSVLNNDIQNMIKIIFEKYQIKILEFEKFNNKVRFIFDEFEYVWNTKLSAYSNIEQSFKQNKYTKCKLEKAQNILIKTEKTTNKKKTHDDEEIVTTVTIKGRNKIMWFEEFNWFFTSDGLLFVSGKTSDQNEVLVKKYLSDGDLYVHSEVFGSGSGIIKNNNNNIVIERDCPRSIEECGNFLICHTKAWKDGVGDKSYWVYPSQVSKTTETGEYVTKGSFIVRGTKNFIPTQKMELGLGVFFKSLNNNEFVYEINEDIEFAMAMVGAYTSLSKFKFKIKITPGTQKIKKVFSEVLGTFYKKSNIYEKTGIKSISNDEWQKILVTGIKFHL